MFDGELLMANGTTERAEPWFEAATQRKLVRLRSICGCLSAARRINSEVFTDPTICSHVPQRMDRLCWNEDAGMYFDYNFVRGEQSTYQSATTVYPLWARMASPAQARRVWYVRAPTLLESP